ncbi:MAG: hypothetical protein EXR72_00425 [Myxococcales bacterium]|nr:hypothetical protein [Myxococcales bacterium]
MLPSAGGGWRHLAGLGIGATYDFVGWPGSIDAKPAPTACGGKSTCKFGTREQRAEVGLRFRWRFVERTWSPLLITSLGYGFHSFTIDPPADGVTIVPSVTYQYVDLGVGLRLPILGRVTVAASVNGHALATAGAIRSSREYGPGGGGGVRGNLVAEARLWRSLSARLSGFYEVFWLDFDGGSMPKKTTDGTTSDAFWGLTLSAGYAY